MKSKRKTIFLGILFGFLSTLYFITFGLIIVLNWRGLYYNNTRVMQIAKSSGIRLRDITKNYNALMDYCSPRFKGSLTFPSLIASPSGLSHFAEVKNIFNTFYFLFFISLILVLNSFFLMIKHKNYILLKISAITTAALPIILGLLCIIDFDSLFLLFHKIVFRNDDWLFDPETDPIILLLPSTYFMYCAIVILAVILCGASLQYFLYRTSIRYRRTRNHFEKI